MNAKHSCEIRDMASAVSKMIQSGEFDYKETDELKFLRRRLYDFLDDHGNFGYEVDVEGLDERHDERKWYMERFRIRYFENLEDAWKWVNDCATNCPELITAVVPDYDGVSLCVYEKHYGERKPVASVVVRSGFDGYESYYGDDADHETERY